MSILLVTLLLVTGCSRNPSELACSVWENQKFTAGKIVDDWSNLSGTRKLTIDESKQSWKAGNDYVAILNEMDTIGCKN